MITLQVTWTSRLRVWLFADYVTEPLSFDTLPLPKKGVSRRRPLGKQSASLFSPPPTAQILVSVTALPIPSSFSSQKTHGPLESLVCWQCREDGISLPRWKVDPSLFWEHPPFVRATSLFCCSARSVGDPLYEDA